MDADRTLELSLSGEIVEILSEEKSRSVKILIRPFSISLPLQQDVHLGDSMTLNVRMTVTSAQVSLNSHSSVTRNR